MSRLSEDQSEKPSVPWLYTCVHIGMYLPRIFKIDLISFDFSQGTVGISLKLVKSLTSLDMELV